MKKTLLLLSVFIFLFSDLLFSYTELSFNNFPPEAEIDNVAVGEYTIVASSPEVPLQIEGFEKAKISKDNIVFNQRLKLDRDAYIDVIAQKGDLLNIYSNTADKTEAEVIVKYANTGEEIASFFSPRDNKGVSQISIRIPEDGKVRIYSPQNSVYVYLINIKKSGEQIVLGHGRTPELKSIGLTDDRKGVKIELNAPTEGTDITSVNLVVRSKEGDSEFTKALGKKNTDNRTIIFYPEKTDSYIAYFQAFSPSGSLISDTFSFDFTYPLEAPSIKAYNKGDGNMEIFWDPVKEAEYYKIKANGKSYFTDSTSYVIKGLVPGSNYRISVSSVRGNEETESAVITKTAKREEEKIWRLKEIIDNENIVNNRVKEVSSDPLGLKFYTEPVIYNSDAMKETMLANFYYVEIKKDENFDLEASFLFFGEEEENVENDAYGIMAFDSVDLILEGTNLIGILNKEYTEYIDDVEYYSPKNFGTVYEFGHIVGDQFYAIDEVETFNRAFSYKPGDATLEEDVYIVSMRLDNDGFTLSCGGQERIFYSRDELFKQDTERLYVGFYVSNEKNLEIEDIHLNVAKADSENRTYNSQVTIVPYRTEVLSPLKTADDFYEFAFVANSDGRLRIIRTGSSNYSSYPSVFIRANEEYRRKILLNKGDNQLDISFIPDSQYSPGENMVMGVYNGETLRFEKSSEEIKLSLTVSVKSFSSDTLYVAPDGKQDGDGTKERPLDLYTAVSYCKKDQKIILLDGYYNFPRFLDIEKGNDGTFDHYKVLEAENRGKVILDFSSSRNGFSIEGNYWKLDGLVIIGSRYGSAPALRITGSGNQIVNTVFKDSVSSGLVITGEEIISEQYLPSFNEIRDCISINNGRVNLSDGSGFETRNIGEGNAFYNVIALNNATNGFKIDRSNSTVRITNSLAINIGRQGEYEYDNGVGYRLGRGGAVIENAVSYNNTAIGVYSDGYFEVDLTKLTAYKNGIRNLELLERTDENLYDLKSVISLSGVEADIVGEEARKYSINSFFYNGKESVSPDGKTVKDRDFESLTYSGYTLKDGKITLDGFLDVVPNDIAAGADF